MKTFKPVKNILAWNNVGKMKHKKMAALLLTFVCTLSFFIPSTAANENPIDYSPVFDANYYYNTYPDLQQTVGNDPNALLKHFTAIGMKEGRNGNSSFQVKAYMQNNLDLLPVYGVKDLSKYYLHYISIGQEEDRIAAFKKGAEFPAGVLSSYSTTYDVTEDRAINVELAAARINGMVVRPGEKFSFSNSIGTRTIANGYVVAPSFASGRVVSSVGGGICQVSSTIYVAMLLAYIPPTQRYAHSLPVDYVPTGLDAAIVEGYKDLTFTNNFDYSIGINATTKDGVLTISFLKQADPVQ
ncbi:VanW family protein [Parablautia muri]|uniref:Vancomycin resistance protein n=1 Tax=Parablautia muri TaxID=2320879 RepID=A0A9X5BDJ6_9FIRM|nr:VanW family protein [Parablautia muri]NBJ91806.1 vancomycin resistance protein [Parablautia muri]